MEVHERCFTAANQDGSIPFVELRVERAICAKLLGDVDFEGVRLGVHDAHLGDFEGGLVDIALRDVGVAHIDSIREVISIAPA